MTDPDHLVLVARVSGAFGVKGEVRIKTYTDNPLAVVNFRTLAGADGQHALTLVSGRSFKEGLIARAKEIATKEEADALKGLDLYAPRSAMPAPETDEFYLADLIGLRAEAPDGSPMGMVKSVQNYGAGDLLEIQPPGRKQSWMVAFSLEVVPEVDIPGGRIVVSRPAETE
ncbi:MAG TPA: ribosome maturation factor RimM [Caulobacteraceae bacterium]|nr:ribosome maturation factor RimM [Caulobacteraceae bacterium]